MDTFATIVLLFALKRLMESLNIAVDFSPKFLQHWLD